MVGKNSGFQILEPLCVDIIRLASFGSMRSVVLYQRILMRQSLVSLVIVTATKCPRVLDFHTPTVVLTGMRKMLVDSLYI